MTDAAVDTVTDAAVDTRPRATTTKAINLAQLDAELGGYGLCIAAPEFDGDPSTIVVADGSPLTQDQLDAGVDAHLAVFPPPAPTVEEKVAAALEEATDFASFKAALAPLLAGA